MLYKKNNTPKLDMELYKNPTSEYRGTPFWAWNCKLEKDELERQIEVLKEMGFGGFHMHSRSGMATKYLSEEFMNLVKACRDKAEAENMLAWLYDEDRWPSGAAGGYVTKDKSLRQKMLVFSENPVKFYPKDEAAKEGLPYLLAVFDAELDEKGLLKSYKMIGENEDAKGIKRYAYVEASSSSGWYNGQAYADTLSKEAIQKFIDITYSAYEDAVGESFDKSVPAIFTDEPQFFRKQILKFAKGNEDAIMPWTTDFAETYMAEYGEDIISKIPEIFWDLTDGKISVARYRFHDHICQRFTDAFAKQCGTWCKEHGIALTGHMMEEPTLESQTHALGEAMRAYEWFGIPGIDLLCNHLEITTAKQAQSAAHQYGKEAVLSELYGVTNWDFDFRGHKYQGDWQAALGITVRVPHLSWVSMKGSAKRDYPASINYQAPWHKEYKYVEDHFARLNTVLTRGKPLVNVGVIHPIESFWLYYGPQDTGSDIRHTLDKNFIDIATWLADGIVEYNFISESLLPTQCKSVTDKLNVGEMNYGTVIVPGCRTIRRTTFNLLKEFSEKGGKLIFAGECPTHIDALPTDEVRALYEKSVVVEYDKLSILKALEGERTAKIVDSNGKTAEGYLHGFRQDGNVKWFFLAHHKYNHDSVDCSRAENLTITINSEYIPKLYNTIEGTVEDIDFETKDGKTYIYKTVYDFDSLLIQLTEGKGSYFSDEYTTGEEQIKSKVYIATTMSDLADNIRFNAPAEYTRTEDNVVLLDIAKYKLDEGEWKADEEILRLDTKCREVLEFPMADGKDVQPWVIEEEKAEHFVTLKFNIESTTEIENVFIAGEEAESIKLNGREIHLTPCGYYVDKSIKKYNAGKLLKGINEIEIKTPITKRISVENYFLLGDFDVKLQGCKQTVIPKSNTIGFGDITAQGMPFYGGNVVYKTEVDVPESTLKICVSRYRGALTKVLIDGREIGNIVYPPYILEADVTAGKHTIEFVGFGNRVNTFGSVHNIGNDSWVGPSHWYSKNYEWSYEYALKPTGILTSPTIEVISR